MDNAVDNVICIDPEIMGGTPVFSGTRVPVQSLFDWLETETIDEFLDNFPSVSRDQALSVLQTRSSHILSPKGTHIKA